MTSLGSEALPARLFKAIPMLREALLAAAEEGRVVPPSEASEATDGAVTSRGIGKALEVISADCARRGEPDLSALVVREASLVDGTDTGGGARRRVWMHFGGQGAVDSGAQDERDVVDRLTRHAGASRPASSTPRVAKEPTDPADSSDPAEPKAPSAAAAPRVRASRAAAAKKPAPVPAPPPSICPDCFTVRSASGICMC
ncbi:hypothetical protein SAMN06264364_13039 [Quadrisphaera granulorum]|uniref:Uncharacterized protein n=1 Tax=Quadrisphaera granulorum TaxID=317664 RepID=A0A315ZSD9_9ACTN|nr:hypothetical protein [Quadrisphaera granulorum]PWJ48475.1 hypothetical protein BXY45_13039 [Quadrisphaera granulorum]SZE98434.1 hypothetical protein SAMN06264364_13039 [Quadrisphaera granulorum]